MKLSKPIEAHGESVTEIVLREPTGDDIMKCGLPMEAELMEDGSKRGCVNTRVVGAYIALLGGIPPSSVRLLAAKDFAALSNEVQRFFT